MAEVSAAKDLIRAKRILIVEDDAVVAKVYQRRLIKAGFEVTLANEGGRFLTVTLAGYEDRVPPAPLGPGATRTVTFLADRPGEAFAFLVDGEPSGRLAVTGSHLPEGHR